MATGPVLMNEIANASESELSFYKSINEVGYASCAHNKFRRAHFRSFCKPATPWDGAL
jgi:hypothetical protein